MNVELPDYYIEPCENAKIFGARTVRRAGQHQVMCIINTTDRYQLLKRDMEVGRAFPVDKIIIDETSTSNEQPEVNQVQEAMTHCSNTRSSSSKGRQVPKHLQKMFDSSINYLNEDQHAKLAQLLTSFEDVFGKTEFDPGTFTEIEHKLNTGDAPSVKQRLRRTPACFTIEEEAHLKTMLEAGVIQESTSELASSPVFIRKSDGSVRYCIDYRALKKVTVKDVFPLPLVDDCLDTLSGNVWFSKLDANSAYWQVHIYPGDRRKMAFTAKYGLYKHVKMGFGL